MSSKYKYLIAGALVAIAFVTGRYTTPVKTITEIKTVMVKDTTSDTASNDHKTIVILKKPDGETTTTITDNSSTDTHKTETDTIKQDNKTETTYAHDGVTISALAGLDVTNPGKGIAFGASISKPILGPISLGVFGLSNGTGGISLGIKF